MHVDAGRDLKETVLWGTITWSEIAAKLTSYKGPLLWPIATKAVIQCVNQIKTRVTDSSRGKMRAGT